MAVWTCAYGGPCSAPFEGHFQPFTEGLVKGWLADDRGQRQAEAQAEQKALHGLAERGPVRGRFNAIARDVFFGQQAEYYLEGIGVSGLTYRPFAKVRLASSYVTLFVDIAETLKGLSKNKRRKAVRHGKGLPKEKVNEACNRAIRHYLAR